jgi:hypothetical protein
MTHVLKVANLVYACFMHLNCLNAAQKPSDLSLKWTRSNLLCFSLAGLLSQEEYTMMNRLT